jgi:hypothetical protein
MLLLEKLSAMFQQALEKNAYVSELYEVFQRGSKNIFPLNSKK